MKLIYSDHAAKNSNHFKCLVSKKILLNNPNRQIAVTINIVHL